MNSQPRNGRGRGHTPDLPEALDDGLPTLSVGEWSRDKHYFLLRYLDAFVTAMRKKGWSGLHYIDLFCGPGLLKLKDSKELIWGSPMIAAFCQGFDSIHLCDEKHEYIDAVRERIAREAAQTTAFYYAGDANVEVRNIASAIPSGSLSVAFLDPFGLHLHFSTLEVLAKRRVDLIIFFPDHLDILRNCEFVYKDNPNSNLDKVFGNGCDWRSIFEKTPNHRWAEELRKKYVQQIRKLGYKCFEYQRIMFGRTPGYCLIFCSHHPVGAKIWRGTSKKLRDGQDTFDFA